MREILLAEGEHYHIIGRGNNKEKIFLDDRDYSRFLFLILYFQSSHNFINIGRNVTYFKNKKDFGIEQDKVDLIVSNRYVELVNFCIMPNHYHLTVFNKTDKGISKYMQRVLNAYAKYFNTKYKQTGHVFQGPYKAVHISDDVQLQYLSTYIHKNPTEIKGENYKTYKWSSYQDYIDKNRWGGLLKPEIITESFGSKNNYKNFVQDSPAKDWSQVDLNC